MYDIIFKKQIKLPVTGLAFSIYFMKKLSFMEN